MSSAIDYDTSNLCIEYHSNAEYRSLIRTHFRMDVDAIRKNLEEKYENVSNMDQESLDELLYDHPKMNDTIDKIFYATRKNKLFLNVYKSAAGHVLSNNPSIGICILFSYDYYYLFHACLCVYLNDSSMFNENLQYYNQLKDKLQKK